VPDDLLRGFEAFRIDPEWQWVLTVDGKIAAQLLAAPMHGVLMILRVTALPTAPASGLLHLLRHVCKECAESNLLGYTVFLSDNTLEGKLLRIAQRAGAYIVPASGAWVAGRFDTGY
jgi:hypothetical protein